MLEISMEDYLLLLASDGTGDTWHCSAALSPVFVFIRQSSLSVQILQLLEGCLV